MTNTPALDFVLSDDSPAFGKPDDCVDCSFGMLLDRYEDVAHDLAEADYECSILGRKVWGESAPCSANDWRARARIELESHYERKPGITTDDVARVHGMPLHILEETNS